MAVPKKRRSKAKKRTRRAIWLGKVEKQGKKEISLAKSMETGNKKNVINSQD